VGLTTGILPSSPFDVPLDPDAPEAHQWLVDELSKAEYQASKPTWFEILAGQIRDWLSNLTVGGGGSPPEFGVLAIVIGVVIALVIAFLVFGLPRLNRKSRVTGAIFGEEDERTSVQLRAAADAAAKRGEFDSAIADMFRAIARGLAERAVLTTTPGTTAHDFGQRAGQSFPSRTEQLAAGAQAFDDVRYLGREGTRQQFDELATLERGLRTAKPVLADLRAPQSTIEAPR
jgi:hypothetical protein